jgi:hypothetical protein
MLVPGTLVGAASLASSLSGQGTHNEVERITRKGHAIERRVLGGPEHQDRLSATVTENLANSTRTRLMLKWSGLLPSVGLCHSGARAASSGAGAQCSSARAAGDKEKKTNRPSKERQIQTKSVPAPARRRGTAPLSLAGDRAAPERWSRR